MDLFNFFFLLGSIIGLKGNSGQSVYSASKGGLVGFSRALAKEVARKKIRVNVVAPGQLKFFIKITSLIMIFVLYRKKLFICRVVGISNWYLGRLVLKWLWKELINELVTRKKFLVYHFYVKSLFLNFALIMEQLKEDLRDRIFSHFYTLENRDLGFWVIYLKLYS